MSTNKITCSFTVDRDIYNAYKSIVVKGGENVKGNLIRYMLNVINYETPNALMFVLFFLPYLLFLEKRDWLPDQCIDGCCQCRTYRDGKHPGCHQASGNSPAHCGQATGGAHSDDGS